MFNVKPKTNFRNNLDAIKLTLVDAPTMEQLRDYLPGFANATWAIDPNESNDLSMQEKDQIIRDAFNGKTLPTALSTASIAFTYMGLLGENVV